MCLCIDTDFSQCILEIAIIRRWDTRFANPILSTVTFLPSSGVKILTLRALLRDLVCSLSKTHLYLLESSLSPSPRFKLPNTPMAFQRLESIWSYQRFFIRRCTRHACHCAGITRTAKPTLIRSLRRPKTTTGLEQTLASLASRSSHV